MRAPVVALAVVATFIAAAAPLARAAPAPTVNVDSSKWPQYTLMATSVQMDSKWYVRPANAAPVADTIPVATARWSPDMNSTGWNYFQAESAYADAGAGYRIGLLEGYLTGHEMTLDGVPNAFNTITAGNADVVSWVTQHIQHLRTVAPTDVRTAVLDQLMKQMQGIADGYNQYALEKGVNATVTFNDVFAQNFAAEIWDVQQWAQLQSGMGGDAVQSMPPPRHCSALVRVTADDLYVSHDTWTGFESMRRFYKSYTLPIDPVSPKAVTVAFSAYSATIASGDDWYQTSHGLAVQETTLVVNNIQLYQGLNPNTISEFLRVMMANYIATTSPQWVTLFSTDNSGTYNNQYMAVDFKLYQPGQPLKDNTLWVVEQMVSYINSSDCTQTLRDQGFWPSYNVPYFSFIYNISGNLALFIEQGNFWSYSKYARPEIFARNAPNVSTLEGMKLMMRFNQYKTDPFSLIPNCTGAPDNTCTPAYSAMLTIASRGDLNPPNDVSHYGPLINYVGQRDHCSTDSKIALWSQWQNLGAAIISGPTYDDQPPFVWSTSPFAALRPAEFPDKFEFPWVALSKPPAENVSTIPPSTIAPAPTIPTNVGPTIVSASTATTTATTTKAPTTTTTTTTATTTTTKAPTTTTTTTTPPATTATTKATTTTSTTTPTTTSAKPVTTTTMAPVAPSNVTQSPNAKYEGPSGSGTKAAAGVAFTLSAVVLLGTFGWYLKWKFSQTEHVPHPDEIALIA